MLQRVLATKKSQPHILTTRAVDSTVGRPASRWRCSNGEGVCIEKSKSRHLTAKGLVLKSAPAVGEPPAVPALTFT